MRLNWKLYIHIQHKTLVYPKHLINDSYYFINYIKNYEQYYTVVIIK